MDVVIKNVEIMLLRRGYLESEIKFLMKDEFDTDKPRFEICSTSNIRSSMSVFFIEKAKVSIQVFKSIISTSPYKHIMVIHAYPMTPDTLKNFNNNYKNIFFSYFFESFTFDEMSYDPIESIAPHKLVKDKPLFWNKLPIILSTDIIARYYLFTTGDVISIKEENGIIFRRCV